MSPRPVRHRTTAHKHVTNPSDHGAVQSVGSVTALDKATEDKARKVLRAMGADDLLPMLGLEVA